jgi:hypothetical protein
VVGKWRRLSIKMRNPMAVVNSRDIEKGGEACLSVRVYDVDICWRTRNLSKGGKK